LAIVVAAEGVETLKSPARFGVHQFENRATADVLRRACSTSAGVGSAVEISALIDYQSGVRVAAISAAAESVNYSERLGCGWS
jgi:hypothetical protein